MGQHRLTWVRTSAKGVAVATLGAVAAFTLVLVRPVAIGDATANVNGHADLLASVPAEGDSLSASPQRLRLAFAEAVDPAFSSIDLVQADGVAILDHAGVPDPLDRRILEAQVPELKGGVYQVRWRTLSSGDGHAAFGSYAFRVVAVIARASAALPASSGSVDQVARIGHGGHGDTLGRTLGYLGTMLALGLGPFAWLVVRPTLRRIPDRLARLSAGALVIAAVDPMTLGVLTPPGECGCDGFPFPAPQANRQQRPQRLSRGLFTERCWLLQNSLPRRRDGRRHRQTPVASRWSP